MLQCETVKIRLTGYHPQLQLSTYDIFKIYTCCSSVPDECSSACTDNSSLYINEQMWRQGCPKPFEFFDVHIYTVLWVYYDNDVSNAADSAAGVQLN